MSQEYFIVLCQMKMLLWYLVKSINFYGDEYRLGNWQKYGSVFVSLKCVLVYKCA